VNAQTCDKEAFEVQAYEESAPYKMKIKGPLIVDRTHSFTYQIGGDVEIEKNLDIDAAIGGMYTISGGSLSVGTLSLNEGSLVVNDAQDDIK